MRSPTPEPSLAEKGLSCVDFNKLPEKLAEPFWVPFFKHGRRGGVYYFAPALETQSKNKRVLLIVGSTLYLCNQNAQVMATVLISQIKELATTKDGWVAVRCDLTRAHNILVRPAPPVPGSSPLAGPRRLLDVIKLLYKMACDKDLQVGLFPSIKALLQQCNGLPPQPPGVISITATNKLITGSYVAMADLYEDMPQWKKDEEDGSPPTVLCSMGGVWVVSMFPASRENVKVVSTGKHKGLMPPAMNEHGGWQESTPQGWSAIALEVEPSVLRDVSKESSVSRRDSSATSNTTFPALRTPAGEHSPEWSQATSPQNEYRQLKDDIFQSGLRIQQLKNQAVVNREKVRRYEAILTECAPDRDQVARELGLEMQKTDFFGGEVPSLAPHADQLAIQLTHEADTAEASVLEAQSKLSKHQLMSDELGEQEASLKQQLAAAKIVQQDSKVQLKSIQTNMQELVQRAQAVTKLKEEKALQLGQEKAASTREVRQLVAVKEKELNQLQEECAALEQDPQDAKAVQLNAASLRVQLDQMMREATELEASTAELELKHSEALASHVKANTQLLATTTSPGPVEPPSEELTEACNQLSVAMARLDELEGEASDSGTLRWWLERKNEEVAEMDCSVRHAILVMQDLRRVYDQKLSAAVTTLKGRQQKVKTLQEATDGIMESTSKTVEKIRTEQMKALQKSRTRIAEMERQRKAVEDEAAERENKKRWAYEQKLLLSRCQSATPSVDSQSHSLALSTASVELAKEQASLDNRVQAIDKELISLQHEVLKVDDTEMSMKKKRDDTWKKLSEQEHALRQVEGKEADIARVRENISLLQQNMQTFLSKTQDKRATIRKKESRLLVEKEQLLKRCSDLRHQEREEEDAFDRGRSASSTADGRLRTSPRPPAPLTTGPHLGYY